MSGGRTLTVAAAYEEAGERAEPATCALYLKPLEEELDYASPYAGAAWGAEVAGAREAALTASLGADGWYRLGVRALTAGGTSDGNTRWERVYVSSAAPAAAAGLEAAASRG
ncbi:MAG: hypothetical protein M5U26_16870 [Planctomycetota bacterium]|nr:hypothetical protein [Planctomycetota bacterium]